LKRHFIILATFFLALTGCNNFGSLKNNENQADNSSDKTKLKQMFITWQNQEIDAKQFLASDSCNPEWFAKHGRKENLDSVNGLVYGFPSDTNEYKFSFADLNSDGKLDGLVVFTPNQCDGGNASMWIQWQVFLLSDNKSYMIIDTLQVDKFASTEFDSLGFYWLDSISTNKIYGKYYEFIDTDGRCCPSINKPVTFDFKDRKLTFIGMNIDRK
jgi:hypothetical protein